VNAKQLPHLQTFATAAELGSFSAAARALGLTQAAISQRLQTLEKALEAPLFHRKGGRVVLTEAGHRLFPFAQRILALHQEAREAITGLRAPVVGNLVLAASSVPGEHFLPELLGKFREQYPHIHVQATVTDTRQVLHQIERGQANLGLVGGKMDNPKLEFRRFASDQLMLVVPGNHAWKRRAQVTLNQLAQEPLILREAGSGSRWCFEKALAEAGTSIKDLKVVLELGSNEAIKEAVLRGLGLAVLSIHTVSQEVEAGRLHAVQVEGLTLDRAMFVVWDRQRPLPIPAQLFLDFLTPTS
jgi:DNA-binding transcriptional LysR family regulator